MSADDADQSLVGQAQVEEYGWDGLLSVDGTDGLVDGKSNRSMK